MAGLPTTVGSRSAAPASATKSNNATQVFVVGVLVAMLVIFLHLWGKYDTDARTQRAQEYSQTDGAREERAYRLALERLEAEKLRAQADLERAKRLDGRTVLIPPNGAVCQDGYPWSSTTGCNR